jgi:hypothetical protein
MIELKSIFFLNIALSWNCNVAQASKSENFDLLGGDSSPPHRHAQNNDRRDHRKINSRRRKFEAWFQPSVQFWKRASQTFGPG